MTNFEKIKSLTIDEMALINVNSRTYNSYSHTIGFHEVTDYETTDGNLFDTREQAESYERSWLQQELDALVFGE